MSSYRQKKQLTTLENVLSLTDPELREALKQYNLPPGPITDSTRNLYRKKLASLIDEKPQTFNDNPAPTHSQLSSTPPKKERVSLLDVLNNQEDLEDTSDEDYNEEEESTEETEDEEEDEEEEETDEENLDLDGELDGELDEPTKLTTPGKEVPWYSSTSKHHPHIVENGKKSSSLSRGLLILLLSLCVAIISFYLFSNDNYKSLIPRKLSYITKLLASLLIVVLPVGFILYKTLRFYLQRRNQQMQRVCELVENALELLQSADSPKGQMPILHIRDNLLKPAERKSKDMINLWNKAVKFIEEHESRVKVEMVNIDGEAFRAWKWIGTKKM